MRIRLLNKINLDNFLCCLCIAFFIIPDGLSFIPELTWIETTWRLMLVVAFVGMALNQLMHFRRCDKRFYNSILWGSCLLSLTYGFCTIINNGNFSFYAEKVIDLIGPWLLLVTFASKTPNRFLNSGFKVFFMAAIANILGVIWKYPQSFRAFGDFWLFGQRNAMRDILLPALLFSVLRDRMSNRTITFPTIFLLITNPIILFIVNSMTSLIFTCLLEIVYIAYLMGVTFGSILKKYMYFYLGLQITVVFMRRIFFSNFITSVLNRSLTFSGRTEIWDVAITRIIKSPFIGTGIHAGVDSGLHTLRGSLFSHCHNAILEVLYKGGAFALIAWGFVVIVCLKALESSKDDDLKYIIGLFVGTSIIIGIFADTWSMMNYLMLFMSGYIAVFSDIFSHGMPQKSKRKKRRRIFNE